MGFEHTTIGAFNWWLILVADLTCALTVPYTKLTYNAFDCHSKLKTKGKQISFVPRPCPRAQPGHRHENRNENRNAAANGRWCGVSAARGARKKGGRPREVEEGPGPEYLQMRRMVGVVGGLMSEVVVPSEAKGRGPLGCTAHGPMPASCSCRAALLGKDALPGCRGFIYPE